jgi:hypothetical protein
MEDVVSCQFQGANEGLNGAVPRLRIELVFGPVSTPIEKLSGPAHAHGLRRPESHSACTKLPMKNRPDRLAAIRRRTRLDPSTAFCQTADPPRPWRPQPWIWFAESPLNCASTLCLPRRAA